MQIEDRQSMIQIFFQKHLIASNAKYICFKLECAFDECCLQEAIRIPKILNLTFPCLSSQNSSAYLPPKDRQKEPVNKNV